MEQSDVKKKCKILFRPPTEYGIFRFQRDQGGPIVGDRAALLCDDGRVLILDISGVVHIIMDPDREIPDWWWWCGSDDWRDDMWYNDDWSGEGDD